MASDPNTFTPINDVGEFGLIDRLQALLGAPEDERILAGIGDDAAVYRIGGGRVHVMTTDALVEGVHFNRTFTPLMHLGFKALAVNVSDVLAMNALPRYATVALGLPNTFSVEMVEALYRGMKTACEAYGLALLGGDTTAAHRLTLSVTVIGEADEDRIVYRSGARPGDVLCVTGDLGAAYAGLKVLLDQRRTLEAAGEGFVPDLEPFAYVIQRQLAPAPRLNVIEAWAAKDLRPHALIDISDGLASEVHHLCRRSRCGAVLQAAALPIDLETRRVADHFAEDVDTYALFGGEDYELLFALPEDELDGLEPESFAAIGRFTEVDQGVSIRTPEGGVLPLEAGGYRHFGTAGENASLY